MIIGRLIDRFFDLILPRISMRRVFFIILLFCLLFFIFSIIAYAITVDIDGFANWKDFFTTVGSIILNYSAEWSDLLVIIATLLLAFAAFWVISDTRHFRYLDDKTKVISDLNNWAADVIKHMSLLARQATNKIELKKNQMDCRAELMIKVAQSVGLFATARKLSTDVRIKKCEDLTEAIDCVDQELRNYVTLLFKVDVEEATKEETDQLINSAENLTNTVREIIEIASQI